LACKERYKEPYINVLEKKRGGYKKGGGKDKNTVGGGRVTRTRESMGKNAEKRQIFKIRPEKGRSEELREWGRGTSSLNSKCR